MERRGIRYWLFGPSKKEFEKLIEELGELRRQRDASRKQSAEQRTAKLNSRTESENLKDALDDALNKVELNHRNSRKHQMRSLRARNLILDALNVNNIYEVPDWKSLRIPTATVIRIYETLDGSDGRSGKNKPSKK